MTIIKKSTELGYTLTQVQGLFIYYIPRYVVVPQPMVGSAAMGLGLYVRLASMTGLVSGHMQRVPPSTPPVVVVSAIPLSLVILAAILH